ncbi:m-AAA protease-interacting protein 1, mitochondrial [Oryzias melastigma]|uniref:Si:dkey-82o10.4 n=1 Tax=Oryzias melastigma TaxID=30732 RepID=A0A3B3D1I0_ORYME|nr:m-AAA protease-interacting protein 1, mitochondrial [Oryzias melastigma]
MQRLGGLAARRELGGFAAGLRAWRSGFSCGERPSASVRARAFVRPGARSRALLRDNHRAFCSRAGTEGPPRDPGRQPPVSVVGIPDPLTWIRCKVLTALIDLYFDSNINSEEFDRGVKQALVHVSNKMSRGRYHELKGLVSFEMVEYVEKRCGSLTDAQRKQLSVNMDDIIFVLPEDVSVVFDQFGRKFCSVVMRFWLLSSHEGPEDPEGSKIFKVAPSEEAEGPQRKIATAVYEFHRELTSGAPPDWTITTVWHWSWGPAK